MYIEENVKYINNKLLQLKGKENVLVWGASVNTVKLFEHTDICHYKIKYIIDNRKAGRRLFGLEVQQPGAVNWDRIDAVVISSFYREDEIARELSDIYGYHKCVVRINCDNQEAPFYEHMDDYDLEVPKAYQNVIAQNSKFKNIHNGERLFILCNGPSINEMDLNKLKGERTIAVSNFYMHKDIKVIEPDYYCIPHITYTDTFTEDVAQTWLKEMVLRTGDSTQYFFHVNEKNILDGAPFFSGRKINYLYYERMIPYFEEVDLARAILPVQSVPVLCLQIAIYMGFKEVYLLGTEHSEILTGRYSYFYDRKDNIVGNKDNSVNEDNTIRIPFREQLLSLSRLWEQYKILKAIAENNGIKIYNATKGGILDIYERVDYDSIFR